MLICISGQEHIYFSDSKLSGEFKKKNFFKKFCICGDISQFFAKSHLSRKFRKKVKKFDFLSIFLKFSNDQKIIKIAKMTSPNLPKQLLFSFSCLKMDCKCSNLRGCTISFHGICFILSYIHISRISIQKFCILIATGMSFHPKSMESTQK